MWRQRLRRIQRVKKSRKIVTWTKYAFLGTIGAVIVFFVALPLLAVGLPSPEKVVRREGFSTKILDRNGETLYDIYVNQRRDPVSLTEVPLYLRQATISIEDKNFYKHKGFDVLGMVRGLSRIFSRGFAQGGSTLTQQLVKNVLLSSERTIIRKIKEFVLAIQIETRYSKDEILQMYLNEAPYGGTAYGVEAASEVYFGKSVNELNLIESAILAGFPQSPSSYSPYSSTPKAYVTRTTQVLKRMREDGYITSDQEKEVVKGLDGFEFQPKGASFKAPHFVQYVQKILEDRYGENVVEQGGLKVTTTLDLELQEKAQNIVAEEIAKVEAQRITNGAAVAIDPATGEVLAMVGSKNFNDPDYDGQVNVTVSLRQPGSAFKPFTYATALKKGYTASTLLMDVETVFPGGKDLPDYKPVNYDAKYRGPMQVRYALGNSINIAAVKMLAMTGVKNVLETAHEMGITTLAPTTENLNRVGLSLTLGGGEVRLIDLTAAYAPFMNKGYRVDPVAILKVEDLEGKVLEEVKPKLGKRVLTEEQAFLIANILSDNLARQEIFGTNSLLNVSGRTLAVKTGTTNDKRDNWTVGGNPYALVGVWVGNNDNTPMLNVASGVSGASPIWRRVILEALAGKPNVGFEIPSGIVSASVDAVSGYRAHDGFPSRQEYFIKGTEPGVDKVHVKLKVCKSDGKLATPSDIASGNWEEKEFFVFKEEDFTSPPGGLNRWQEGILNWLNSQSDPRYHSPSDYCGTANPVNVEFFSPKDQTQVGSNLTMEVRADSTSEITKVEFYKDGETTAFAVFTNPPYKNDLNLPDGVHTLKAKAKDSAGHESERTITVGVNGPWNPTPVPTFSPTPSPIPSSMP